MDLPQTYRDPSFYICWIDAGYASLSSSWIPPEHQAMKVGSGKRIQAAPILMSSQVCKIIIMIFPTTW